MFISTSWARSGKEYKVPGGPSGQEPYGRLITDSSGNLYGTTYYGGYRKGNICGYRGCGTVFMLSPTPGGGWTGKVIYTFLGGNDGGFPGGNLTIDAQGNLYGIAGTGLGIIFKLSPNQDGSWTETVIYKFLSLAVAAAPSSGLVFDSHGNIYGTTSAGGVCDGGYCGGTVYQLAQAQGAWTLSVIYNFPLRTGENTYPGGLSIDGQGNLYGVTSAGGSYARGTVFEVSPNQDGTWTTNTLYEFQDGLDGGAPNGAPVLDAAGNLYGEASEGGSLACPVTGCGLIFRLVPNPDGTWTYGVVYTFNGPQRQEGTATLGWSHDRCGGGFIWYDHTRWRPGLLRFHTGLRHNF